MTERRYVHDRATYNQRAPKRVVPWLMEQFVIGSVLDAGCGLGTWTAVFAEHGCEVLGLDTGEVPEDMLQIPRERYRAVDFEVGVEAPGRFDLALCLEVAEHLTDPAGRRLVKLLTSISDLVLFSAAIPNQGGDHHLNERWPLHWQELFEAHGYWCDDDIRWRFWDDEDVDWWYRQNMFIARRGDQSAGSMQAVVHPRLLEKKVLAINDFYYGRVPVQTAALVFMRTLLNALRRR